MDIKHIITAIAVTSMGVAYCELPPVPDNIEVYDAERDGISYNDEVTAGRTPTSTDYEKADEVLLKISPNAYTSKRGHEYRAQIQAERGDAKAQERIKEVRKRKNSGN